MGSAMASNGVKKMSAKNKKRKISQYLYHAVTSHYCSDRLERNAGCRRYAVALMGQATSLPIKQLCLNSIF